MTIVKKHFQGYVPSCCLDVLPLLMSYEDDNISFPRKDNYFTSGRRWKTYGYETYMILT